MNNFEVGQKVTWTHTNQRGSTLNLSTREGVVTEISEHACKVRKGNGRQEWLAKSKLRGPTEKPAIIEFFTKLAEAVAQDARCTPV